MTDDDRITTWAPDLVIYHDKCADGIVAAWACWKRWGDEPEYLASNYGYKPPSDVMGRNILMVDFSFPEAELRAMVAAGARSIVILDHHKTAQAALEPFAYGKGPEKIVRCSDVNGLLAQRRALRGDPIIAIFDMNRSGARMAWDFATPFNFTPRLIELAERYDLWRFKPGTSDPAELLHLVIQTREMSIRAMDYLDKELAGSDLAIRRGEAIYDWRAQLIKEIAGRAHLRTVAGVEGVIAVECPYSLVSAVGHHLLDKHPAAPFAAMSVTGEKHVSWSLRSDDGRTDVSAVAKGQGGGGHRNAAGFRVSLASLPAASEGEPNCSECGDSGTVFGHAEECDNDSCALNGDMDSCLGKVEPCPSCPAPSDQEKLSVSLESALRIEAWNYVRSLGKPQDDALAYVDSVIARARQNGGAA